MVKNRSSTQEFQVIQQTSNQLPAFISFTYKIQKINFNKHVQSKLHKIVFNFEVHGKITFLNVSLIYSYSVFCLSVSVPSLL